MFTSLLRLAKDIVFPLFCAGCKKEGTALCGTCARSIKNFKDPWFRLPDAPEIFRIFAPFRYEEGKTLATLIHLYKYGFAFELHKTLCELILPLLLTHKEAFAESVLVPIPLHKKRLKWRGFNHAGLIAQECAKAIHAPLIPLLCRRKNTKPQAELTRTERLTNLQDAFSTELKIINPPKRIFLVDDVVQTGITLTEAARALRKDFDGEINALVIARNI